MAGLLTALAVMAIVLSVALPTWRQAAQREKEEELIFRGKQYARAVELYQRRIANAFPPSLDVLVEQKFLRKKYLDPMTEDGEFQPLYQLDAAQQSARGGQTGARAGAAAGSGSGIGQTAARSAGGSTTSVGAPRGGVIGVVSKSKEKSIRLYNGRNYYNEWQFVYLPTTVGAGGIQGGAGGMRSGEQRGGADRGGPGGMGGMGGPGAGRGGRGGGGRMGPGGQGGRPGGPGGQGFPGGPGGQGFPGGQGAPGRGAVPFPGGAQRGPGGLD